MSSAAPTDSVQTLLDILRPVQGRADGLPSFSPSEPSRWPQQQESPSTTHVVDHTAPFPSSTPATSASTATSLHISNLLASLHSVNTSASPIPSHLSTESPSFTYAPHPLTHDHQPMQEEEYDPSASYAPVVVSSSHHDHLHQSYYQHLPSSTSASTSAPTATIIDYPPPSETYSTSYNSFSNHSSSHLPLSLSLSPPQPSFELDPAPETEQRPDLSSLTFAQSLPHLVTLSSSPAFLSSLRELKSSQDKLERNLFDERKAIIREHRKGVEKAKVTAGLIGLHKGVPEFEQKLLADKLKQALNRFAIDRLLPAWDTEVRTQQITLASLGVPTMGGSDSAKGRSSMDTAGSADLRDRQRRVVGALEGMMD